MQGTAHQESSVPLSHQEMSMNPTLIYEVKNHKHGQIYEDIFKARPKGVLHSPKILFILHVNGCIEEKSVTKAFLFSSKHSIAIKCLKPLSPCNFAMIHTMLSLCSRLS